MTAWARIQADLVEGNPVFETLARRPGDWRWLSGPHARVRYPGLAELLRAEAATLAPAPYASRFEHAARIYELRLERLPDGTAVALLHEVTSEVRRQNEMQRDREGLLHEERMHAMGVLASGVAHDLNHALNVMALRIATLRAQPTSERTPHTLAALSRIVGEAARIVSRLQDLARRRRDRPSDPLDLAAVLTGALEMARTDFDAAGVRVEADVPPLPLVRGSAAELAPVFGTLFQHAREQMPDGGAVRVRAREERGRVSVTIEDEGEGLSEGELQRVFDPFGGVGRESSLGLAIAWGVLTRLGGSLTASSRRGRGTTFTLVFPLATTHRPERVVRERTRTAASLRVLVIDDEPDNVEVLREVLELEGQRVATAGGGPEALQRIRREESFDVVLCDVGMPQMSGWQVAREIAQLSPHTRIWMLTGWANEIADSDPRRALVRGVLAKPLDLEQLRAVLAEPVTLREPQAQEGAAAG